MEKKLDITYKKPKECCSARDVLWYLVFCGFAVNYMIRINLNIAIVSMVTARTSNVSLTSECIIPENVTTLPHLLKNEYERNVSTPQNITDLLKEPKKSPMFPWDERMQSNILGSFFWLHWCTQIPGGILGSKYGAKTIFGLSNLGGILLCFFIPMAAVSGSYYLILVRVLQGLFTGFSWPSMHNMTARWIPPNERSKFVTAYLGSSVGAALTYPLCGFIIDKWGWEVAFYTCGVMGAVWFVAWWILVYDSPAKHPRISDYEKNYILDKIGQSYTKQKAPVPWSRLLLSLPVWMNILAQWGGIWGLFTLMTHTPTYFKFIHGWNIRATGILSGMPHVMRMMWAWSFAQLADFLLQRGKLSRTNVRKLATASCTIGQGVFVLALAYSGCNHILAVVLLTAAIAMNGSVSTGPLAAIVDISPNYASIILGIVNTVVAMVGFITPAVVGYLTFENQTAHQWQKVFWISAFMLISCGILYMLFAKSDEQPWNSPADVQKSQELIAVKGSKGDKNEAKDGYQKVLTTTKQELQHE